MPRHQPVPAAFPLQAGCQLLILFRAQWRNKCVEFDVNHDGHSDINSRRAGLLHRYPPKVQTGPDSHASRRVATALPFTLKSPSEDACGPAQAMREG
jgi:hypothetical protein